MDRKVLDFWVGVFLIAGFLALVFLALQVGGLNDERSRKAYDVQARFENIGGLKLKAPVKSSGVVVGRVTDIHFDNKTFQASVTLSLETRYSFPKDTSASILTSGLLGEVYIGLEAGGDDKLLKAGDKINLTQSAVVLERLIGQFMFGKASEGGGEAEKPAKKN